MDIGTRDKAERDARIVEGALQFQRRLPDLRTGVVIKPRKDVRRARHHRHPSRYRGPGHLQRNGEIRCAIVDTGQHMAMQIDHWPPNSHTWEDVK